MQTPPTVSLLDTPKRRKPWLRRVALGTFVLVPIVLLTTPYAVRVSFVRERIAQNLTEKLGVATSIGDLAFGWRTGIAATSVRLANPSGFDAARPMMECDELRASVSLRELVSGRADVQVHMRGLRLSIEQGVGGSNLDQLRRLADGQAQPVERPSATEDAHASPSGLAAVQLALSLADAAIEIRRQGELVESVTGLQCSVRKEFDRDSVACTLDAVLAALPDRPAGKVHLQCEANAATRAGNIVFRTSGLDLGRFRPLLTSVLAPTDLTQCRGTIAGEVALRTTEGADRKVQLAADLTIASLRLAGDLLPGLDLQVQQATLRPSLEMAPAQSGAWSIAVPLGGTETIALGLSPSSVAAEVTGLHLQCDLARLQRRDLPANTDAANGPSAEPWSPPQALRDLPVRLDASLRDAQIEIRRGEGVLESFTALRGRLQHNQGSPLQLQLETQLAALPDRPPGDLQVAASVDWQKSRAEANVTTTGIELARVRAITKDALPPDAIATLAGRVSGSCRVDLQDFAAPTVSLDGQLRIADPHVAGAWLGGMNLRGQEWTLRPSLRGSLADWTAGKLPRWTHDFAIDLGCASMRAVDGDENSLAVEFALDVAAMAAWGGPIPDSLGRIPAKLRGSASLPLHDGHLPPLAQIASLLVTKLDANCDALDLEGMQLRGLAVIAEANRGELRLQSKPGSTLNQGALQLTASADLRDLEMPQGDFALQWSGGRVEGQAIQLLKRLVPLLAGSDGTARIDGLANLTLNLRGPLRKQTQDTWLAFANQWSGDGSVAVDHATVTPAPALAGLIQPLGALLGPTTTLGDNGKLLLDAFGGSFTMAKGTIESKAMRWISKGRSLGLSGRVGLDGAMAIGLDLRPLLQEHKDGARVIQLLGNQPVEARLGGSVDQPTLRLPDLGKVLQNALTQPSEALQKQAEQVLRKGLLDLLNGRKEQSPKK